MCGILGYFSRNDSVTIKSLINKLKKLEYRGYDSSGCCFKTDSEFITYKKES